MTITWKKNNPPVSSPDLALQFLGMESSSSIYKLCDHGWVTSPVSPSLSVSIY